MKSISLFFLRLPSRDLILGYVGLFLKPQFTESWDHRIKSSFVFFKKEVRLLALLAAKKSLKLLPLEAPRSEGKFRAILIKKVSWSVEPD